MTDTSTTIERKEYPFDVGKFGRPVTTKSSEAQLWFNRGLTWAYAFNHKEASVCFEQAIAHDESCAMAYWGLAYALGPNYNQSWEFFGPELETVVRRTYDASQKAQSLVENATPVEKALIHAIQRLYQSNEPATMEQYNLQNLAYAAAMEAVYANHGDDLDVAALYAQSLITLTPWKLWNLVTGEPNPGTRTLDAKKVIETAFAQDDARKHPGLLHMYIHLIEMSPTPELGLVPADNLRDLVPDAGHVHHMPSHLDILVGDYRAAVLGNQRATIADEKFLHHEGAFNFYTIYRMHNYHTLAYAAMFAGQKRVALDAAARMEATLPKELLMSMADFVEVFISVRSHVMVRFGMWDEIIQLPLPDDPELYCVTTALALYAKGVAYAATGNIAEAERHRDLYREAEKRVPATRLDFPNKCIDILGVASPMLDGEIEYRRGNYDQAFEFLRRALEKDDELGYSEPWSWMQPVRHAYAALLLEQGHVEEAANVYRADLGLDDSVIRARQHPNNVWALQGYHECLVRLGRTAEARTLQPQLKVALAVADVPVKSSCFCRTNTSQAPDVLAQSGCTSGEKCHI
ncbi:hypothetical protein N7462_004670 [Penicillium macrosclerotiorum]|uniref:uncharacterized protein n=1 Tax=Penicillium macrosclerotiorum TaxID=303699 RepID=UPI0025467BC9|nr:uncharacterized protein N7462_004670 [Penicillium macrosclerotiorum]KAJ5690278.1 hypothetical protein N7462_004670 [Penicillium macrosclerotiorum]